MSRCSDLSTQHDSITNPCATRQTHLGRQHRIFPDLAAVADLDKVVDLGSCPVPLLATARPIVTGIVSDLFFVLQHGNAGLHDLVISPVLTRGKAESVTPDD